MTFSSEDAEKPGSWKQGQEDMYSWEDLNEVFMRLANLVELGYVSFKDSAFQKGAIVHGPGEYAQFRFSIEIPYELMKDVLQADLAQALEARGTDFLKKAAALMKKQKEEAGNGNVRQEDKQGP